jgi:hypothetical protein
MSMGLRRRWLCRGYVTDGGSICLDNWVVSAYEPGQGVQCAWSEAILLSPKLDTLGRRQL